MTEAFTRVATYVNGTAKEVSAPSVRQLLAQAAEHQTAAEGPPSTPVAERALQAQLAANKIALYRLYRLVEYGD